MLSILFGSRAERELGKRKREGAKAQPPFPCVPPDETEPGVLSGPGTAASSRLYPDLTLAGILSEEEIVPLAVTVISPTCHWGMRRHIHRTVRLRFYGYLRTTKSLIYL